MKINEYIVLSEEIKISLEDVEVFSDSYEIDWDGYSYSQASVTSTGECHFGLIFHKKKYNKVSIGYRVVVSGKASVELGVESKYFEDPGSGDELDFEIKSVDLKVTEILNGANIKPLVAILNSPEFIEALKPYIVRDVEVKHLHVSDNEWGDIARDTQQGDYEDHRAGSRDDDDDYY